MSLSPPPIYELPKDFLNTFFERYESPYSYRYGSAEMRYIWSETHRYLLAHDLWIAVAQTQHEAGLVFAEELQDLVDHRNAIDVAKILKREMDRSDPKYSGHETQAAISQYAEEATVGARILHGGMTSEDMMSNVEAAQIKESFAIIEQKLNGVIEKITAKAEEYKDVDAPAYNFLQRAGHPIKLGDRFRQYDQDFQMDLAFLRFVESQIRAKGIKGAVGTSASFVDLLKDTGMTPQEHEKRIMERLGLAAATVTGQTAPRKYTLLATFSLCSITQSCHKFAQDLKILQSSPFDEMMGPKRKVSSTAMPGKKSNPITAETIQALAREMPGKVISAWEGAAKATLERGMEDSAGERSYLPEAFLIVDEILGQTGKTAEGLQINKEAIARNLHSLMPLPQQNETPVTGSSDDIYEPYIFDDLESTLLCTLRTFQEKIAHYHDFVTTAYTHDQAAEPTTVGYRLARYAQDMLVDLQFLRFVKNNLLGGKSTYNKYRLLVTSMLSAIAQTYHQFAGDTAKLQSTGFGELKPSDVSPKNIMQITGEFAGKLVTPLIATADESLETSPNSEDVVFEKKKLATTLQSFSYALHIALYVLKQYDLNIANVQNNLNQFGPFMALEIVLSEYSKKGGNRQDAHKALVEMAQTAWEVVARGESNPIRDLVKESEVITGFLSADELDGLFDSIFTHYGDAPDRCQKFITEELEPAISSR